MFEKQSDLTSVSYFPCRTASSEPTYDSLV